MPAAGEIVVATTRPETMLGDTAVAVHPEDPRCRYLFHLLFHDPFTNIGLGVVFIGLCYS